MHPFTCLVSGPTQSGKTEFLLKLLENHDKIIEPSPNKIMWCYGEYNQRVANALPTDALFKEGLWEDDLDPTKNNLLILDDLMMEANSNKFIEELFIRRSHHQNVSVILTVHNLFYQGKSMRTISLNTHYFILFKNPRDAGQVKYLGNQLFPTKGTGAKFLGDAYKQATSEPHGYLLLDLKQETPENLRVLSNIFPSEETYCYLPRK